MGQRASRSPFAVDRARSLRRAPTPQEVKLWVRLRALRVQGFHIRRQVPRDRYVLDFACLPCRIIIEVDGAQHGSERGTRRDAAHDEHFAAQGFRTLRFTNREIDVNLDGVVETLYLALRAAAPVRPHPTPLRGATLPASGEG